MSNEEPTKQPEEPLALQMDDPAGPPQPVKAKGAMMPIIGIIGVGIVGGLLIPAMLTPRQTCGATRSAKVKWEQRQHDIDRAQALHESRLHE
jgi:hypothetical protein